ncbi:MAG: hypothetical protein WBP26_03165 [Candidatus Saccharimonadales bacterium]
MSLTQDDLQAIQTIVQNVVDRAIEDSDIRTANAFAEVHDKFAEVHEKFAEVHDRIDAVKADLSSQIQAIDDKLAVKDGKLENTVQRVDALEDNIRALNLKTA